MPASPVTPASAQPPENPAKAASPGEVSKNMFLQLLVAQLRNQNPLRPTDSMQFVQQLAQFQQMEQSANMGQDITSIRQAIEKWMAGNSSGAVSSSASTSQS
jgi:flagellar basal-body rod modification protein FlgD